MSTTAPARAAGLSASKARPAPDRPGPRGVQATTRVVIGHGRRGGVMLASLQAQPPLGVRLAGGEVHLLGTAGGPHGGDRLSLQVVVLAGVRVTIRSVAATVALPGDGGQSVQTVQVEIQEGAALRWLVQPLVVAAGADHVTRTTVEVAPTASLTWREEIVLGRAGETAGRLSGHLRLTRAGRPLLHQGLSTRVPGWAGPAVTGGAGTVGLLASVSPAGSFPDEGSRRGQRSTPLSPSAGTADPEIGGVVCNDLTPDLALVTGVAPDIESWRSGLRKIDPTLGH